jgi:hypothetical protein
LLPGEKYDIMKKDDGVSKDSMAKDGKSKKKMKKGNIKKDDGMKLDEMSRAHPIHRAAQGAANFAQLLRVPSFPRAPGACGFLPFKVRPNLPSAPERVGHTTGTRGVTLTNRLFWRHHVIHSMHERAAWHVKRFAAVNDRHKMLRQSPRGLAHLGEGRRHEVIERGCQDGRGSKRAGDPDTHEPRPPRNSAVFNLIGEPVAQPRVEARGQGEHRFVAIKLNDIAHAIAHGLAMRAPRKMLLQRLLQGGIKTSVEVV